MNDSEIHNNGDHTHTIHFVDQDKVTSGQLDEKDVELGIETPEKNQRREHHKREDIFRYWSKRKRWERGHTYDIGKVLGEGLNKEMKTHL